MVNFKKFLTIYWYADITYYGKKTIQSKINYFREFLTVLACTLCRVAVNLMQRTGCKLK